MSTDGMGDADVERVWMAYASLARRLRHEEQGKGASVEIRVLSTDLIASLTSTRGLASRAGLLRFSSCGRSEICSVG